MIIYIAPKEPEEGKLLVFDSMNSTRDDEIEILKKGICHLLQQDIQMLQPEYVNCKKQEDSYNCGIFSILLIQEFLVRHFETPNECYDEINHILIIINFKYKH